MGEKSSWSEPNVGFQVRVGWKRRKGAEKASKPSTRLPKLWLILQEVVPRRLATAAGESQQAEQCQLCWPAMAFARVHDGRSGSPDVVAVPGRSMARLPR